MSFPAHAALSSVLIVSSTSRPCCSAVRMTLASIAQASAADALRLPPVILRMTTAGRSACSAALLVPSTSGLCRNVVSLLRYLYSRLPSRSASSSAQSGATVEYSRFSSRSTRCAIGFVQRVALFFQFQHLLDQPLAPPEELVRRQFRLSSNRIAQLTQQVGQALLLRPVELVVEW